MSKTPGRWSESTAGTVYYSRVKCVRSKQQLVTVRHLQPNPAGGNLGTTSNMRKAQAVLSSAWAQPNCAPEIAKPCRFGLIARQNAFSMGRGE